MKIDEIRNGRQGKAYIEWERFREAGNHKETGNPISWQRLDDDVCVCVLSVSEYTRAQLGINEIENAKKLLFAFRNKEPKKAEEEKK